jgi:hypothetical protein
MVVPEGTDLVFYRRLYLDVSGTQTAITKALTSSIAYKVFDSPTTTTAAATGTLVVNDVIYDTLQTWSVWTTYVDSTGGNFRGIMARSLFADGNKTYRVEFTITLASGYQFMFDYEVSVKDFQSE